MKNMKIFSQTDFDKDGVNYLSFDDNFEILGTIYNQHQQLANAVPPLLGKAIATSVKKILDTYET